MNRYRMIIRPCAIRFLRQVCAVAIAAALTTPALSQATWRVDDDAPNDPAPGDPTISDPVEDGSAAHPFDAIQEAIDASVDGDTVLIADGVYTGAGNRDMSFGGRAITVRSKNGAENCTIDCEQSGRAFHFFSQETADSVLDGLTIVNGYEDKGGAVYCQQSSPSILNSRFFDNSTPPYPYISASGGAIHCRQSSVTISSCLFSGNESLWGLGGATYSAGGNPGVQLYDCEFNENEAGHAGAVFINDLHAVVERCRFTRNSAPYDSAGALAAMRRTRISDCLFAGNAAYAGGAFAVIERAVLENCVVIGNFATAEGGGFWAPGAYMLGPTLIDCVFGGNAASSGGAVFVARPGMESTPLFFNCSFSGNYASGGGGGIAHLYRGDAQIWNCAVVGNAALGDGEPNDGGGGFQNLGGDPDIVNSVVSNNWSADHTGGVLNNRSSRVRISNSIVWGNADPGGTSESAQVFANNPDDPVSVEYCCVQNWSGALGGDGNFGSDPLFAEGPSGTWTAAGLFDGDTFQVTLTNATASWFDDELAGRFVNPDTAQWRQFLIVGNTANTITIWADWETIDSDASWVAAGSGYQVYDYHLTPASPCIDAGDNDAMPADLADLDGDGDPNEPVPFDFDGNARFADDPGMPDIGNPAGGAPIVDIGAYEFQGATCFADINRDSAVGLGDLALLLSSYGEYVGVAYADGDLDRDGDIDTDDLYALLEAYGTACE